MTKILSVLLLHVLVPVETLRGVVEADDFAYFFVNGVYMPQDQALPVLPMNSERAVNAAFATAMAIKNPNDFEAGDVIAMQVQNGGAKSRDVTNVVGEVTAYQTFAGAIAAFEDGTMTSSEWRCTTIDLEDWNLKDFDDSNRTVWQPALEQPEGCCPWRDVNKNWNKMHAKWISPASIMNPDLGAFQAEQFYCRYIVPSSNSSRLPDAETQGMSPAAPGIDIAEIVMGNSIAQVWFNVSKEAEVFCGVMDARYLLRVPTPLELIDWGQSAIVQPTDWRWFLKFEESEFAFTAMAALAWIDRPNLDQCKLACEERSDCKSITWYDVGYDLDSKKNCKLMGVLDFDQADTVGSGNILTTTLYYQETNVVHEIIVSGMLLPGTIYTGFCAARNHPDSPTDDAYLFSTWESVAATATTERTQSCIDCGSQEPPIVWTLGGWATETELTPVVGSDRSGRMFCAAVDMDAGVSVVDAAYILEYGWFNILTLGGGSVPVPVRGLSPGTRYELYCMAESDSGIASTQEDIMESRRLWNTESSVITIATMAISSGLADDGTKTMKMTARVTEIGYIWCWVGDTPWVAAGMIPVGNYIQFNGQRQKMEDIRASAAGTFPGLWTNISHEIYCTASEDDFSNESVPGSELDNPFPRTTIVDSFVSLDSISLTVLVGSGPAWVTCKALSWQRRPQTSRPVFPTPEDFDVAPYVRVEVKNERGASMKLKLESLATGSWHDVFCYSEEIQEIIPGALPPPKKGMDDIAILDTRRTFLTEGPQYEDAGWHCTVGRPCSITDVVGQGLTSSDSVFVRMDRCPGTCKCSGAEDPWHKGAECSSVLQGDFIAQPPPGSENNEKVIDKLDPRGAWCYVGYGTCDDAQPSNFTSMIVSWTACSYNQTAGLPGVSPPGFARNGIALTSPDRYTEASSGDAFYWNTDPMITDGGAYSLCWCNGTASGCKLEVNYRLGIGVLHASGPSEDQLNSEVRCVAGAPCIVENFKGHALFNESRLAVVPKTDAGCEWQKASPFSYPGVAGFPQIGVSDEAKDDGGMYSWGGSPVLSEGASYLLCWCGAVPVDNAQHRRRTNARDIMPKADAYKCSATRPDGGAGFLAPAGTLGVIGPMKYDGACSIGMECRLDYVPGYGLQAGDLMAVLKTCGDDSPPPPGWFQGASGDVPDGWITGGWMVWGEELPHTMLTELGAPLPEVLNLVQDGNMSSRGIWGFPNKGISAGPAEGVLPSAPGKYRWGAPTWAFSGDYKLCWCGASRGIPCFLPEHFVVDVGTLSVTGPAVLPAATQVHTCVRGRRCDIERLAGTIGRASEVFISAGECGTSAAPKGAPRDGFSLPTPDGRFFGWDGDPIQVVPGKYRICYCPTLGYCYRYEDYGAFAGILSVKGPLSPEGNWFCVLGMPCNITGIWGEGLGVADRAKVMTVCGTSKSPSSFDGNGFSMATYNHGTAREPHLEFTLPPADVAGKFRVCFCPSEAVCVRGEDFFVDLGRIEVGGPDMSMTYLCYEWVSCTIQLVGDALSDGDRVKVVPSRNDCNGPFPTVEGWPLGGFSQQATDGGAVITWVADLPNQDSYVLATPDQYTLCWCSAKKYGVAGGNASGFGCSSNGPFNVRAGSIRLAPYIEYQYLNREPDPDPRDNDTYYAYMLALPLPCLFCVAIVAGYKKLSSRKNDDPEAPPLFAVKKAWAAAAQENAQSMYAIKQVLETRVSVTEQMKKKNSIVRQEMSTPSYLKVAKKIEAPWVRRKRERELAERMALANDPDKAEAGMAPPGGQLAIMAQSQTSFASAGSMTTAGSMSSWGEQSSLPGQPSTALAMTRSVFDEQLEIDRDLVKKKAVKAAAAKKAFRKAAKKAPPPKIGIGSFSSGAKENFLPQFGNPACLAGAGVGQLTDTLEREHSDSEEESVQERSGEWQTSPRGAGSAGLRNRVSPGGSGGSLHDRLDM